MPNLRCLRSLNLLRGDTSEARAPLSALDDRGRPSFLLSHSHYITLLRRPGRLNSISSSYGGPPRSTPTKTASTWLVGIVATARDFGMLRATRALLLEPVIPRLSDFHLRRHSGFWLLFWKNRHEAVGAAFDRGMASVWRANAFLLKIDIVPKS